jgi:hypothetical protein
MGDNAAAERKDRPQNRLECEKIVDKRHRAMFTGYSMSVLDGTKTPLFFACNTLSHENK